MNVFRMRRRSIILTGIGLLVIAGLAAFGAAALIHPVKRAPVIVPAPTSAFRLTTGVLPPGWRINAQAASYLNLEASNGCFTTSTLTTMANYQNLSSVSAFNKALAPSFATSGYVLSAVSAHPLKINASGTIKSVSAIYYELSQNTNTSYHIDSGELGTSTAAFMSVSCPSQTELENAQIALLGVTYNDTYKP